MRGDTAKARAEYQDFLLLWRDADAAIPMLIAAKYEYSKLNYLRCLASRNVYLVLALRARTD
jgi:hypothetical protein